AVRNPGGMASERGRTQASFLVTLLVVVAVIGGYVAWTFLRPDPYALSERMVRESRREVTTVVREFQRDLDRLGRDKGADLGKRIEQESAEAVADIEALVSDARDRLGELDIDLRTERNRMDRIKARAQEGQEMIAEYAAEAKAKLQDAAP
ncbi:MAG: hypothetical protein ACRERC_04995, partial [Candidatus Binatia bacterium]